MDYLINKLIKIAKQKGYDIFDNQDKNFNINFWGIRREGWQLEDLFVIFWKFKNKWMSKLYIGTTDPTKHWLENPMNRKGCAKLVEGQHRGLFKYGYHKDYEALVQAKPCKVLRDNDKDDQHGNSELIEDTGMFGINCHYGFGHYASAGCQVFWDKFLFKNEFMPMIKVGFQNWDDTLTYTLIKDKDLFE